MNLPLEYLFAGSLLLLAVGMATVMAVLPQLISKLFGLNKNQGDKYQSYECGMDPVGGARVRFSIKFYIVAMLFILFDIETIFMYPWASVHRWLGWFGLAEMAIFLAILFVGYIYVWKRGALQWE
jgi:NADH-quinone oxidoreductase subunit A